MDVTCACASMANILLIQQWVVSIGKNKTKTNFSLTVPLSDLVKVVPRRPGKKSPKKAIYSTMKYVCDLEN